MWRNCNTGTLLEGMYKWCMVAAKKKTRMEVPQKTKQNYHMIQKSHFQVFIQKNLIRHFQLREFPLQLSGLRICLVSMRMRVQSLASLSGLGIWCCHELWFSSQMRLGSCIAVAVAQAGSCSSNSTPSLGTSICHQCSPKTKTKKKKKKKKKKTF